MNLVPRDDEFQGKAISQSLRTCHVGSGHGNKLWFLHVLVEVLIRKIVWTDI